MNFTSAPETFAEAAAEVIKVRRQTKFVGVKNTEELETSR